MANTKKTAKKAENQTIIALAKTQEELERLAKEYGYDWRWVKNKCRIKNIMYVSRRMKELRNAVPSSATKPKAVESEDRAIAQSVQSSNRALQERLDLVVGQNEKLMSLLMEVSGADCDELEIISTLRLNSRIDDLADLTRQYIKQNTQGYIDILGAVNQHGENVVKNIESTRDHLSSLDDHLTGVNLDCKKRHDLLMSNVSTKFVTAFQKIDENHERMVHESKTLNSRLNGIGQNASDIRSLVDGISNAMPAFQQTLEAHTKALAELKQNLHAVDQQYKSLRNHAFDNNALRTRAEEAEKSKRQWVNGVFACLAFILFFAIIWYLKENNVINPF